MQLNQFLSLCDCYNFFLLAGLGLFYSNKFNPISSEDNLEEIENFVKFEPESYNLHSDGKILTTVDNSLIESPKKINSLLFFYF